MAGYDYRQVISIVTDALVEKAAREMQATPAAATAEAEIVATVNGAVLPGLRGFLTQLAELQAIWTAPGNNIQGKIIAAAQAGQPLAGYSPLVWAQWGEVLKALLVFLETPIDILLPDGQTTITTTPKNVLLTRYVAEG